MKTTFNKISKLLTLLAAFICMLAILCSCGAGEKGEKGDAGKDGLTPFIGENGNWWIGATDTGVSATGIAGPKGDKGDKGDKGNQGIQGPEGEKGDKGDTGKDGLTPFIGENGNWWIGDTDLGVPAIGSTTPEAPEDDVTALNVTKISSHSKGRTAHPGEKITYSIIVANEGKTAKHLIVNDSVPANTTYVDGALNNEDGALSWALTVPAGESKTFTYTVKVNNDPALCDGGYIESTTATVLDYEATTNMVYIEKTINKIDSQYIDISIDALAGSTYTDRAFASWVYYIFSSQQCVNDTIIGSTFNDTVNLLKIGTADAKLLDMIAPSLYGGKTVTSAIKIPRSNRGYFIFG